jgi:hypothetical protein
VVWTGLISLRIGNSGSASEEGVSSMKLVVKNN